MVEAAVLDRNDFCLWLDNCLRELNPQHTRLKQADLTALAGDAGFRRYFRIDNIKSMLAVYAPPQTENSRSFIQKSDFLREQGLRTPQVFAKDLTKGYLLIEDLGHHLLLDTITEENVDTVYSQASMLLLRMQQSGHDYSIFPRYDQQKLREEMELFTTWFVEKTLGLELSEPEKLMLHFTFSLLEDSAEEQPQVVVHRDYHSRNLVYAEDGNFGVIDFQDAVIGPVTYDLVSLFKDCYIAWPQGKVDNWAEAYGKLAVEVGILPPVNRDTFIRWFDWMGLQRHIKVLGIFCRLSLRDHKHNYLNDLPMVVQYVRTALERYPELENFYIWFENTLMPIINQQAWMQKSR